VSARAAAVLLVLAAAAPTAAAAASFTLDQEARREALRVGARSVTVDPFDAEWRVAGASGEAVTVITPFHRLVLAARHAAFRNEPLKDNEPEKLLREQRDRLVLWAHLRGPREDFARFYTPRLQLGDREIEPSFVQNERTAARSPDGGGYLARCVYGFPIKNMTPKARLLLIVRDADGRDAHRFTIDLASMR
jgi:hypothetical protein